MRIAPTTASELLQGLFWPGFVELGDCVFLPWSCPSSPAPQPPQLPDRTAVEAFHNHVHILDHFRHSVPFSDDRGWDATHPQFIAACRLGRAIAEMWIAKLARLFPERRFRVYFTCGDDPIVRFHAVRADEAAWLDAADFAQAVAKGEVLVLETPLPRSGDDA